MRARELMVKNVITLEKDISVQDAARMMNENGIGCLVAVDNGEIIGILTERDLLRRVLETCKNPKETKVSEIMTKNVIVGDPNMELVEATRLMFQNKVKKLPIVEGDRLVGLITLTDIARATHTDEKTMNMLEALSNMHNMVGHSTWQIGM
jgi:CBS domain-containing protein